MFLETLIDAKQIQQIPCFFLKTAGDSTPFVHWPPLFPILSKEITNHYNGLKNWIIYKP